ncbi:MAG TPA: RICIN domain-containing protein [Pilimelia sp.]|nr:RICIN domain-containing protein [Pilimelia sp.]
MKLGKVVRGLVACATAVLVSFAGWGSPASAATGWHMWNGNSQLCLRPAGGSTATSAAVEQAGCNANSLSQWWEFLPTSNGYYRLRNAASGKCMNVRYAAQTNGAQIVQYPCTASGTNDQFFPYYRYTSNGADYYNLIARHSGKCLNVPRNSTASGTDLIQYTCTRTNTNDVFSWVDTVIGG